MADGLRTRLEFMRDAMPDVFEESMRGIPGGPG
jgi:hypothetical protein